ncbi:MULTISPECIES: hypothetical protein [unclassified Vibrio]|uniref:hypothetical protein n=1 Tax=unclassified Vibrio TaxID=2614977 RepID=UPI0012683D62|nr:MULTISPECIES: hypothetical protein [unclassified Vibrio]
MMTRPLPPPSQLNRHSPTSVSSLERSGSSKNDAQNLANIRYVQRLYQLNWIDRLRRRFGWRRARSSGRRARPMWYRCTAQGCFPVRRQRGGHHDD